MVMFPLGINSFDLFNSIVSNMKLVIDSKIPFIRGFAELLGETVYLPGADITSADVRDADVMIIRTRTHCNRQLLEGSTVKFVATATIGYDHIDTDYLREAGISWTNCPGCNAASVAQYVKCCLYRLALQGFLGISQQTIASADKPFERLTLGIVGVGHVGTQVLRMAQQIGFKQVLLCDPPRAEQGGALPHGAAPQKFVSLSEVAQRADIITFHTPLTREPVAHPTYHMADAAFFAQVKPTAVIINSSRGEVVDTLALKSALRQGKIRAAIIDTWEHEPGIDPELLQQAFIATPHIAGYSADGKANGTRMSLQAVAHHFGIDPSPFAAVSAPALPKGFSYFSESLEQLPTDVAPAIREALRLYDPLRDSLALKQHPDQFERLRGNYPLRREKA